MQAFENTRAQGQAARSAGDRRWQAQRHSSTAEAYANGLPGGMGFDCDASHRDSVFWAAIAWSLLSKRARSTAKGCCCSQDLKPGSQDFEDQPLQATGRPLYEKIAGVLNELGDGSVGESGYSSIGAVIGATFPEEGRRLRALMPKALILVPGYGAQGGSANAAAECFTKTASGAVVNSSRGITYAFGDPDISREAFMRSVRENTLRMIEEVNAAVKTTTPALR